MIGFFSCEHKIGISTTSTILSQYFITIEIISEVKFKIFELNFENFKYFGVVVRLQEHGFSAFFDWCPIHRRS